MEEKIFFAASDGLKLCGILSIPKHPSAGSGQKCIILCHGIGVDKDESGIFTQLTRELSKVGFAVFRFDFRAHGESEGEQREMTISGERGDLESAIKLLQEKGFKQFGILGASFGGGAVTLFTAENPDLVKALVLWNALIDYADIVNPTTAWHIKNWGKPAFERAEKFGFTEIGSGKFKAGKKLMEEIKTLKPWQKLLDVQIPILFVHGDKDAYVPYGDSVKYSKLFKNAKLATIEGAEHGFHDKKEHAKLADKSTIDFFLKNMLIKINSKNFSAT